MESTFSKIIIMEVTGKIRVVNAEQQVSPTFKKRELVVATEEQYPQFISINFVQDKCDLLNNYNVGDAVKVSINLRGREWVNPQGETKYFNDIQGWRIEKMQTEAPGQGMPPMPSSEAFEPASNFKEDEHDDLPF
jgi:single-stranded DNA-binding protein